MTERNRTPWMMAGAFTIIAIRCLIAGAPARKSMRPQQAGADGLSRPVVVGLAATGIAVVLSFHAVAQTPPPAVPDEVAKAIDALGDKVKSLQSGNAAVAAAEKKIDTTIDPLRDKKDPDYLARITADITAWLKSQPDVAGKAAAWTKIKDLWAVAGGLRAPVDAVVSDAAALAADLAAPMSDADRATVPATAKLKELGVALDKFVAERGPRIHIISARYGDLKSTNKSRQCDATAYFVGACEGKATCPLPQGSPATTDALDGKTVCGYEPAPLAPDGRSLAEVSYKCIYFGLRQYPDVVKQEANDPVVIRLHTKDKLVCNVTVSG
jgi:hypothetical protein